MMLTLHARKCDDVPLRVGRWTEGPEFITGRPTPDDHKKVWSWNTWRNLTHIYLLDEQMRVQD